MTERTGYLIFGMEGSGTRMLTRLFIAAGAHGDGGHAQSIDDVMPTTGELDCPIVWRRSFPHARQAVDVLEMANRMRSAGWSPYSIVIVRDSLANHRAQVPDHAMSVAEAWAKNQKHFALMFSGLRNAGVPFEVWTYENIVQRPYDVQDYIGTMQGLDRPEKYTKIVDASEKHWETWRAIN